MNKIKEPCPICGQETKGLKLEPFNKELLPCPFCGSTETQLFTVPAECGINFLAGCCECGARTRECLDYKMAIDLWNNRCKISDTSSESEKLAEELAACPYCGEKQ